MRTKISQVFPPTLHWEIHGDKVFIRECNFFILTFAFLFYELWIGGNSNYVALYSTGLKKMWLRNIFIFNPLFLFSKEKALTFAKRYIVLPTLQFPDKNVKRLLLPPTKGKRRAIYCSSENFLGNKCILVVACVWLDFSAVEPFSCKIEDFMIQ